MKDITQFGSISFTYDHRLRRIGHPVRSAIHKPQIGRLVVGWVTTSEYLLLYVFDFCLKGKLLGGDALNTEIVMIVGFLVFTSLA
jgi:hypothetical protein